MFESQRHLYTTLQFTLIPLEFQDSFTRRDDLNLPPINVSFHLSEKTSDCESLSNLKNKLQQKVDDKQRSVMLVIYVTCVFFFCHRQITQKRKFKSESKSFCRLCHPKKKLIQIENKLKTQKSCWLTTTRHL